jgi:tetratricopeptide (TPR) repeat protein
LSSSTSSGLPTAKSRVIAIALVVLVGAAYGRVVHNGFVAYDDPDYVTNNPHVRAGVTLDTWSWALTTGHTANWHPLTWMSHALDCQLFGIDPAGHHLVSAGLHAINAVLLFLALHALTGALWRSAVVAALFAVHPLHVESVAWVAERKDVLSTLFGFLVLLVYARHVARPTRATRILIPILFALGLMAKPMLVTLPFVLLLLDVWPLRRWERMLPPSALIREKVPLFVLAMASCGATLIAQQRGGAMMSLDVLPLATRAGNAVVAYVAYLAMTFRPTGLGMFYPLVVPVPAWKVIGALAILASITAATLAMWRRARYLAVGWLWYLGTLVPVIGIVQVGLQSLADRYTYLPLVGVFIMIAWGSTDLLGASARSRSALATVAAVAVGGCAVLTWRQVALWRDSETIFVHTLAVTSENYVMQGNLGGVLLDERRTDEAVVHLEEALRIHPGQAGVLSNLGVAALWRGRLDEAEAYFRDALKANPASASARSNLRVVLEKKGAPSSAAASLERGNALRDRGRLADAEAAYRQAIALDPRFTLPLNNLGVVLAMQGKNDEAARQFLEALRVDPSDASAHYNLGKLLAEQGRTADAIGHLEEALRIDPGDASARRALDELRRR